MHPRIHIPRRTFLRGLGTLMALPHLDSLVRAGDIAVGTPPAPTGLPRRMAFVYVPNGANMADWTPGDIGTDFKLPFILEPLEPVRRDVMVLSGLTHDKARPNGDGAGDHARASATFLTATQARKTSGVDIRVGVSVDQVVAQKAGDQTPFRSLELGCDRGQSSGSCDSGYSCAYQFNIAWRTPTAPMPPETKPRLAFERLFSIGQPNETPEMRAKRRKYRSSVLDFVLEDARQLGGKLGRTDQRKLDEYLSSVRDLERRIESSERVRAQLPPDAFPEGTPADYADHIKLMYDVMVLAFQTDTTRVASFIVAHDGSNRPYPFIGVKDGHHDLSHHGNDEEKKAQIAKINRFHVEQFAYFIKRLGETREGNGSLLDNCMIAYGSGIADGNAHAHSDLPVLLCGSGGGTITPGRHVRVPKETPMANLFLEMMDRMGVRQERFGDSTGRLAELKV
ncbi:MAG TPA: DUF1552 domain-containing protein [Verrucomicrobiota bacterium]|nr:hypothetical protein [Verrucomicrobiales bacterium]HRI11906.1 DUF1552 domain-containing protein [Verrucomicrobiota bacterium]